MNTGSLLLHEPALRLACFGAVLAAMAVWEARLPFRPGGARQRRWPVNLGFAALNSIAMRLLVPFAATGVAAFAQSSAIGLLNFVATPAWLAIPASIVLLDLAVFGQHVLFHAVPVLWRVHRMHHSDVECDVSTGLRFHPLEIGLSLLVKSAAILLLGAPAVAVLLFEILLNAGSMFSHGNIALPPRADKWLRWLVVTPDMHRIHHSSEPAETNSNFGFCLPWWDNLFGTRRASPHAEQQAMQIGLPQFRTPEHQQLLRLLVQPLASVPDSAGPQSP